MTSLLTLEQADLLTGVLSFFFTIALFSYVLGDNPLYRFALHLFIGVSVGYGALVVVYQVLQPRLITPMLSGDTTLVAYTLVPFVLFGFLVLKLTPSAAPLGNVSIGYLVGVGVAVAVGGAITGTLLPQIQATWVPLLPSGSSLAFVNNIVIVVGTVTTLLYFQFWLSGRTPSGESRRVAVLRIVAGIGQFFVVTTLGIIYGGMILSGVAIFSERITAFFGMLGAFGP